MWAQKDDKEFWLQWLERYRSLKCLWESETKRRASRSERLQAYQELADLAKVINPLADIRFVRSRINAFRTCYRREFKKVEAAKHNGITYTPQLFYYDTLKFVNPDEFADDSFFDTKYGFDDDDDPISQDNSDNKSVKKVCVKREAPGNSFYDSSDATYADTSKTQTSPPAASSQNINYAKKPFHGNQQTLRKPSVAAVDDEYGLFGKRIAAHFRNMQPSQRLLAEKIISDVCIYARMEKLSMRTTLALEGISDGQDGEESEDFGVQEVVDDDIDFDNPDTYIYTS